MSKTTNIPNYIFAIIAVYTLGGELDYIDPEDIALELFNISPTKFSWRKYEDRVDLGAVRDALRDAKKRKNGELLLGDNTNGWMLSNAGKSLIYKLQISEISGLDLEEHRKRSVASNLETERQRMYRTEAFSLYLEGLKDDITQQDFYKFTRVNEYFNKNSKVRRYTVITNAVAEDNSLSDLWDFLQAKFVMEK